MLLICIDNIEQSPPACKPAPYQSTGTEGSEPCLGFDAQHPELGADFLCPSVAPSGRAWPKAWEENQEHPRVRGFTCKCNTGFLL